MKARLIGTSALVLLLAGCSSIEKHLTDPSYYGPFRTNYNSGGATSEVLKDIQRVAVLPTAPPEIGSPATGMQAARVVQQSLLEEIRSAGVFEAVKPSTGTLRPLEGPDSLRVTDAIPPQLLKVIQQQTDSDAVLFSSVTSYQPYPPLLIGLKVSLVRIEDGVILWQFDDSWNAGDAPTLNDARRFFRQKLGVETDPPPSPSMGSPSRFARYAASVVVRMYQKAKLAKDSTPEEAPVKNPEKKP